MSKKTIYIFAIVIFLVFAVFSLPIASLLFSFVSKVLFYGAIFTGIQCLITKDIEKKTELKRSFEETYNMSCNTVLNMAVPVIDNDVYRILIKNYHIFII
ncbi:MAG: hypothetical protein FWG36_09005 [Oscillospiraceae bacterium]|nr:hypothetical protein [Oscillospiraceae bacterium]